jgi:hypothetical protein
MSGVAEQPPAARGGVDGDGLLHEHLNRRVAALREPLHPRHARGAGLRLRIPLPALHERVKARALGGGFGFGAHPWKARVSGAL